LTSLPLRFPPVYFLFSIFIHKAVERRRFPSSPFFIILYFSLEWFNFLYFHMILQIPPPCFMQYATSFFRIHFPAFYPICACFFLKMFMPQRVPVFFRPFSAFLLPRKMHSFRCILFSLKVGMHEKKYFALRCAVCSYKHAAGRFRSCSFPAQEV